jgi:hypothetical protein
MCAQALIVRVDIHVRIKKRDHVDFCGNGSSDACVCDGVENDERARNGARRQGELPRPRQRRAR